MALKMAPSLKQARGWLTKDNLNYQNFSLKLSDLQVVSELGLLHVSRTE